MEKIAQLFDKKFFKHWFLHALAFWLFMVIGSSVRFISQYGMQSIDSMHNEDGTPVTIIQYFLTQNLRFIPNFTLIFIAFLIEFNYKWVEKYIQISILAVLKNTLLFALIISVYYRFIAFYEFKILEIATDLFAIFLVYIIYSFSYTFIRFSTENQKRIAQNNYQRAQTELNVLKAQLNPHFFFNSLNNLYGTALQENAPKTVGLIEQLSSIMRYTMGEAQENFTDVKNELNFIENYWGLQEIRLPKKSNIQLSKRFIFDEKPTEIAPLLLIPFIENAFKFGSSIDENCMIDLDINVEKQQLKMVLSNTIHEEKLLEKGNGIGIENTKKRLDLIYNNRYSLTQTQEAGIYKVILNIQLA